MSKWSEEFCEKYPKIRNLKKITKEYKDMEMETQFKKWKKNKK